MTTVEHAGRATTVMNVGRLPVALGIDGALASSRWRLVRARSSATELGFVLSLNATDQRAIPAAVRPDAVTPCDDPLSEFSCTVALRAAPGGEELGRFVLGCLVGELVPEIGSAGSWNA